MTSCKVLTIAVSVLVTVMIAAVTANKIKRQITIPQDSPLNQQSGGDNNALSGNGNSGIGGGGGLGGGGAGQGGPLQAFAHVLQGLTSGNGNGGGSGGSVLQNFAQQIQQLKGSGGQNFLNSLQGMLGNRGTGQQQQGLGQGQQMGGQGTGQGYQGSGQSAQQQPGTNGDVMQAFQGLLGSMG